jgi:hypothetical protein
MNSASAIAITLRNSMRVVKKYIEDFSADDLKHRPAEGCHPVAWQLGHLISSQAALLNMVNPQAAPGLPDGFADQYARDKENCSEDSGAYLTSQEYMDLFDRVNAAVEAELAKLSDEDLDRPAPEQFRSRFPTIGHLCILMATHPLMHAGQFVPVRRKLGKPIVV